MKLFVVEVYSADGRFQRQKIIAAATAEQAKVKFKATESWHARQQVEAYEIQMGAPDA